MVDQIGKSKRARGGGGWAKKREERTSISALGHEQKKMETGVRPERERRKTTSIPPEMGLVFAKN